MSTSDRAVSNVDPKLLEILVCPLTKGALEYEAAYLSMNPNSLVPTLEEEDGFTLWESNSIVRYLAAKHQSRVLEPADLRTRALASKWMDWQLSVMAPAITPVFWQMIRTPADNRDMNAVATGKVAMDADRGIGMRVLGKVREGANLRGVALHQNRPTGSDEARGHV